MKCGGWISVTLVFAAAVEWVRPAVGQEPQKPKPPAAHGSAPQACRLGGDGVLKCPRFGFTYKTTLGWVDRTDEMQPDAGAVTPESGEAGNPKGDKSETLLAVFERPPAAPGDTINSAVVIVAESLADYHGIKTAADYFGPITELAEQRGFKVENEPDVFSVGTKQLVRGDFSKPRGSLTMWQSSLVMIEKGHIVSFTFLGGSEDEVDELIGSLSFGGGSASPH
jgi:hypothetical protein